MNMTYIGQKEIYQFKKSWLTLLRPLTLTGSISPIVISTLYIYYMGYKINFTALIVFISAIVLIQMATNIWNDYFDFKSGQDQVKWQTENKNEALPLHQDLPKVAIFFTSLALILGAYLAWLTTAWVVPLGILGILFGFYYSAGSPSLSALGLGEATGAVFLGIMPTLLAFMIQNIYDWQAIIFISALYALLITSMILTNNIRDIEKDQAFRKTIPVMLGKKKASIFLFSIIVLPYILLITLVILGKFPTITLLTLFALYFAFLLYKALIPETQAVCMKRVSQHHIFFSLLLFVTFGLSYIV